MLYNNKLWQEDLLVTLSSLPELDILSNKSILITGAAGLICSSIIDLLFLYNDTHHANISILAAGRWIDEMERRFPIERNDFHFIPYDASKADNILSEHADYLIHGASNAHPALIIEIYIKPPRLVGE